MRSLYYISLSLIVSIACMGCQTSEMRATNIILPEFVNAPLLEGDNIVKCTPPENDMLGFGMKFTCVSVHSLKPTQFAIKIKEYDQILKSNGWQGDEESQNYLATLDNSYLYYRKNFPSLGGTRELYVLTNLSSNNLRSDNANILVFESESAVMGTPYCDDEKPENQR